jgi:hypothetical protein
MSKIEGQGITEPPALGEDGNPLVDENASIAETSTIPTMEELIIGTHKTPILCTNILSECMK